MTVRTRFAPSPTGALHLGGLRTAVVNWLLARSQPGGKFFLRVEDTDQSRCVPSAARDMIQTMKWCGLEFDEDPIYQSQRLEIYRRHVAALLETGMAYPCDCTSERLEGLRAHAKKTGNAPRYDGKCRDASAAQRESKMSRDHVIRFRFSKMGHNVPSDAIILKSDRWPTYHLASVVDDHYMGISHVLRGTEWLASYPLHSALYNSFGWKMPIVRHLPLMVDSDGHKLSKRRGKEGLEYTVDLLRKSGYLAPAIVQFVGLFGWASKFEQKAASLYELAADFSLEKLGSSQIKTDVERLDYFQKLHFTSLTNSHEIVESLMNSLGEKEGYEEIYCKEVLGLMSSRLPSVPAIVSKASYFWHDPSYSSDFPQEKILQWVSCARIIEKIVTKNGEPTAKNVDAFLQEYIDGCLLCSVISRPNAYVALRYILTGEESGAPLKDTLRVLSIKMCVLRRVRRFIEFAENTILLEK